MDALWRRRDRSVLGGGLALGLALVLVAWQQAGHTADGGEQMAWLNLGVAGVVGSAFAAALWVRSGRRAVCSRRGHLLAGLERRAVPAAPAKPGGGPEQASPLLATARGGRYHRPTCPLVTGRPAGPARRDDHEAAGRRPCEVCRP